MTMSSKDINRRPSASEENVGGSDVEETHSESRWRTSLRKKFSRLGKRNRPMSWNCDNSYSYEHENIGLSSQSLYPHYESLPVGIINTFNRSSRSRSFLSSRSSFREETETPSKGFLKKMFSSKKADESTHSTHDINTSCDNSKKQLELQNIHEKSLSKDKREVLQSAQIKNRFKRLVSRGSFTNGIARFKERLSTSQEKDIIQKEKITDETFKEVQTETLYRPKSCSVSESHFTRPIVDSKQSVQNCLENDFRIIFENTSAFKGDADSIRHIDSSSEEDLQENFRDTVNRNSSLFKKEIFSVNKTEVIAQNSVKVVNYNNSNIIGHKYLNTLITVNSSSDEYNISVSEHVSSNIQTFNKNSSKFKEQPLKTSVALLEKSVERVENSLKEVSYSSTDKPIVSDLSNDDANSSNSVYENYLNNVLEENTDNKEADAAEIDLSIKDLDTPDSKNITKANLYKIEEDEGPKDSDVAESIIIENEINNADDHVISILPEKINLSEENPCNDGTQEDIEPKIVNRNKSLVHIKYGDEDFWHITNLYSWISHNSHLSLLNFEYNYPKFVKLFNIQRLYNFGKFAPGLEITEELLKLNAESYSSKHKKCNYGGNPFVSRSSDQLNSLTLNSNYKTWENIDFELSDDLNIDLQNIKQNLLDITNKENFICTGKVSVLHVENYTNFKDTHKTTLKENLEKRENEGSVLSKGITIEQNNIHAISGNRSSRRKRRKRRNNERNKEKAKNISNGNLSINMEMQEGPIHANKILDTPQNLSLQDENIKSKVVSKNDEEDIEQSEKEGTFEPFVKSSKGFKGSDAKSCLREKPNDIPKIVIEDKSAEYPRDCLVIPPDEENSLSLAVCYALERSPSVEFENCEEDIEPLHTVRFCNSSQWISSENEISPSDSYEQCSTIEKSLEKENDYKTEEDRQSCPMCQCNHSQKSRVSKIKMLKCQRNGNVHSDPKCLYDSMERSRVQCRRSAKLTRQLSLKLKSLDRTNAAGSQEKQRLEDSRKEDKDLSELEDDKELKKGSPYENDEESVRWILMEGEEILSSHQTPQTTLAGIAKQVDRFTDFFAYAQLESEKSLYLLQEEQQRLEEGSEASEDTQDLAKDLRRHISSFADRLHLTKDRLEDTAKCYLLLDKAYEWALEAMKIVGRVKSTGAAATPEQVGTAADAIGELLQENPPVSEETFAAMLDLATKLNNQTLLQQCKMAHARCKETLTLLRNRQSALLKARRQMEFDCQSFVDINEILSIPEENCCHSPSAWANGTNFHNAACRKRSGCSLGSRPRDPLSRCSSLEADDDSVFSESPFSSTPSKLPLEGKNSLRDIKETKECEENSEASVSFVRGNNNFFRSSLGSDFRLSQNDSSPLGSSPSTMNTVSGSTIRAFSSGSSSSCSSSESSGPTSETKKDRNSLWRFSDMGIGSIEETNDIFDDRANTSSGPNSHLLIRGSQINLSNSEDLTQEEVRKNKTLLLIMQELLQTERDYVNSLEYIIENFIPELLREDIPQALRGQRNVIFGNIEKIYEFHSGYFLKALENCKSRPFAIGSIFLRYENQFYLYALYNKNKPKSDELMADFGSAFFKSRQIALGDKMDLSSYLLKPVQRMGKYALLLKQLLKECERNEEGYEELKAAQEMVQFQLRHGNDLLAMDSLRDCDVNLKEQGRLLRQGEFLVSEGVRGKKSLRHVFLFEDLILFSKSRKDPEKKNLDIFQYKQSLKTTDIGLTAQVGESPLRFEIWFRKRKPSDTFLFQSPTIEVKEAWTEEISKLLWRQALRNRKLRLHEMSSMGIGNKPCLDIRPSEDQINDRSVSINKAPPRLRLSTSSSHTDASSLARRPHSVISVSSSASSAESSTHSSTTGPSFIGTLNLGFESGDSPKPLQRSVTRTSQCSAESGIITDIFPERETEENHSKVERSNSTVTNTSVDSALSPSTSVVNTHSTPLSPLEEPPSSDISTETLSTDKNKSLLTTEV